MTRYASAKIPVYVTIFFLLSCARTGGAQQVTGGARLKNPPSNGSMLSLASATTDFTVPPSLITSKVGGGAQLISLSIFCLDLTTGNVIPNCNVQVTPKPMVHTGGHNHDDPSRPAGTFDPASGNTGPSGFLGTFYTAPEPSGIIQVTITGSTQDGTPIFPGVFTIGVRIGGLTALPPDANYDLVGSTGIHPDNHYGTATFNPALVNLANQYAAALPGQRLAYNDMSLVEGGVFDISANWGPKHFTHRFGVDGDLRLVAPENRPLLRQLIRARGSGIATIVEETAPPHWHIRQ